MKRVAIIGAGPAGIACALQLKRHGIAPVIFERDAVGGLLRNANLVENYPGFPHGISGSKLVALFEEQLRNAKLEVTRADVLQLEYRESEFCVRTAGGQVPADVAVLATGTAPRQIPDLAIPNEAAERVFYEVHPLVNLQDKTVVIIGAGDAAFDYALNLAVNNEVTILNHKEDISGLRVLYERCMANGRISYHEHTSVHAVALRCGRISLSCVIGENGRQQLIPADYLLVAVSREPCRELIGTGLTGANQELINTGKLYMIGDMANGRFRQTAICVGDGVKAAMCIANRCGAQQ
jgi:thioredoxin reductase